MTPPSRTSEKQKKADHPPYKVMILKAVSNKQKEKSGSSKASIIKFIVAKYGVLLNMNTHVRRALRKMLDNKEVAYSKPSINGPISGSFHIPKGAQ